MQVIGHDDERVNDPGAADRGFTELLLEAFNVTNHVNFRAPLGNPPNAGASINTQSFLVRTVARDAEEALAEQVSKPSLRDAPEGV